MVDPLTLRRWSFRALFAALALLVIFVRILPYHVGEDNWPAPDLLVLLTFASLLAFSFHFLVLMVTGVYPAQSLDHRTLVVHLRILVVSMMFRLFQCLCKNNDHYPHLCLLSMR